MSRTQLSSKGSFLPINRVEALTDGVFAIAMTLLVLELGMPVITGGPVNTELLRRLFELWPKLLVYVLSFVLLGMTWVHHRLMFHYIERSDGKLAWMNIIFLMFVALVPFAASKIPTPKTLSAKTISNVIQLLKGTYCFFMFYFIALNYIEWPHHIRIFENPIC